MLAFAMPSLTLLSITHSATAADPIAACRLQGGDLECEAPEEDEFWWSAAYLGRPSYPCASTPSPTGFQCESEGEALEYARQALANSVDVCDVDVSQQSEQKSYFLGRVKSIFHALDISYTYGTTADPPCQSSYSVSYPASFSNSFGVRDIWCPPGFLPDTTLNMCVRPKPEACPAGNPIQCAGGQKLQAETDLPALPGSLIEFVRFYSSSGFYTPAAGSHDDKVLGRKWRHTWQRNIVIEETLSPVPKTMAYVTRPNGDYVFFTRATTQWIGRNDRSESLEDALVDGLPGWRYTTSDDTVELYDAGGRLISVQATDGRSALMKYSTSATAPSIAPQPGLLIQVSDQAGRDLSLRYNAQSQLISVTDPASNLHGYRYDERHPMLRFVDRPDASVREYRYGETGYATWSTPTWGLLTGIIDEKGQRYASFKYDGDGRAIQEWHGSGGTIDKMTFRYSGNYAIYEFGFADITDALGQSIRRNFRTINGIIKDAGTQRCGNSNCSTYTASTSKTYDANGNADTFTDFRGTTTDHDVGARGLEAQRIEAKTISGGSTPAQKRTVQTDWHATFRKPVEQRTRNASGVLEARRQWSYNSRGQVVARCEIDPTDAAAMAYACSSNVAPAVSAKVRRWTYSYCEAGDVAVPNSTCPILGLAKSENGPRTSSDAGMNSLDDITSYTYYSSSDESGCATLSDPCHRRGDLHTATNALGQAVETIRYDSNGRPMRTRDSNGTITDTSYNTRGWPVSRTVRALASGAAAADDATTVFAYDSTGQIARVTQPDGDYLDYVYDDAHRLTDIVDSLGNRLHYTLDAAGNRTKEETFDASYNPVAPGTGLKRSLAREYNSLSRLVRTLNASAAATRDSTPYDTSPLADGYDLNGNAVQFQDGLGIQTQHTYDPLNRLVKTIQDYTGTSPETGNSTVEYGYDARDNLRSVKDPNNLSTTYTYDGLNNLTALDSPDTGHADYSYDRAGNRSSHTDNRGIASSYTYDALNRLVGVAYPTSSQNIGFHYDQADAVTGCSGSYPLGRLTRSSDGSGTTTYCYDRRGNVVRKTQVTDGTTLVVGYSYTRADRLASLTYPDASQVLYSRDSGGRIVGLNWKATPASTPVTVLSAASYYPFGPLQQLTFGNGRTLTKTYDANYQIDSVASSASDGLKLDFGTDVMGNIATASDSIGATVPTRRYIYDRLYRLDRVDDGANAMHEDYGYNKTGDRTLKQFAGQAAQVYTYLAGTHRLGDVAGAARSFDANGNTTGRGDGVEIVYDQRNRLASMIWAGGGSGSESARKTTAAKTETLPPGSSLYFAYNAHGERVLKGGGSLIAPTKFVYDEEGHLIHAAGFGLSSVSYLYIGDMPLAQSATTGISYLETDHLNTPRIAADPAGNTTQWRWSLLDSAFGEHEAVSVGSAGVEVNLRYPGQYFDGESGLHYNYFRDYEPGAGRYLEADPVFAPMIEIDEPLYEIAWYSTIAGLDRSRYGYASGQPVQTSDAEGLGLFSLIKCWYYNKQSSKHRKSCDDEFDKCITIEDTIEYTEHYGQYFNGTTGGAAVGCMCSRMGKNACVKWFTACSMDFGPSFPSQPPMSAFGR